jgi:hypothetical protein
MRDPVGNGERAGLYGNCEKATVQAKLGKAEGEPERPLGFYFSKK